MNSSVDTLSEVKGRLIKQVIGVFRQGGLNLDRDECRQFQDKYCTLSAEKSRIMVRKIIQSSRNLKPSEPLIYQTGEQDILVTPASYGYLIAGFVHYMCEGTPEFNRQVSESAALYHALAISFDDIMDAIPQRYSVLSTVFNEALISEGFSDAGFSKDSLLLKPEKDKCPDTLISLYLAVAKTFFDKSKILYESGRRDDIWVEFKGLFLEQYKSEVLFGKMEMPVCPPESMKYIYNRSNTILWAIFLISFLAKDTNLKLAKTNLKEYVYKLGELFKIVDDVVDLQEDISNKRWNYLLAMAFRDDRLGFEKCYSNSDKSIESIHRIIENGLIIEAAKKYCSDW